MPVTDINIIKQWYETGDKPTQDQFWNWLDSFMHKSDKIGLANLSDEVINLLNAVGSQGFIIAVNAQEIVIPAGLYDKFIIHDDAGTVFKIGTTEGGSEILEEVVVNADGYYSYATDIHFAADTTIYFTGATGTAVLKIRKS